MGVQKIIPEGTRFGKLTVVGVLDGWRRRVKYSCTCDCGNVHAVLGVTLRSGNTRSCGCGKVDGVKSRSLPGVSDGGMPTPEYGAYNRMKARCLNRNSNDYPDYGGRGINVAEEWLGHGGFAAFLAHVGKRPSGSHSIDRIDVNGGYVPGNVRWADAQTQARNKRTSWYVKVEGAWINAKEASKLIGIPYSSLVNACRGVQGFPRRIVAPEFKRGA